MTVQLPEADMTTGRNTRHMKLFLVDATAFCYRAYYAVRPLSTSRGEPTNAIYGFLSMIRKLMGEEKPDYVAMCFDLAAPTFRHERYVEYKAQRKPTPDDLIAQLEPIKDFCRAFRFPVYELAGYEADDLIGTLARRGTEDGFDVFIISGDKDAMQLVTERVRILNPHKDGAVYGIQEVKKRYDGLAPERVVDMMALMGDASDNIPGVPGIGEKTAIKLIKQFGSLDVLLERADEVKSGSQRALLKEHREQALLSRELATIDRKVPLEAEWKEMEVGAPDEARLVDLLKRYEFRILLKEFGGGSGEDRAHRKYETVESRQALEMLVARLEKAGAFSFDTETTGRDPMRAELVGLSFSWKDFEAAYVPVSSEKHSGPGLPLREVLEKLSPLFENSSLKKYGQNVKYDWVVLRRHGVEVKGITFDTMIASYLINPVKLNHNLDDISFDFLGVRKIPTSELIGAGRGQITMDQVPLEKVAEYACEDADCVYRLVQKLEAKLAERGLTALFDEVEMPLAVLLGRIEMNGVHLDLKFLKQLSEESGSDLQELTRRIYREAGEEFNVNSPKQLGEILFGKLKLPAAKRTKTGYSTDVGVLEKLAAEHALPRMLLEYREKTKLKSTYLDALPEMINPETGLIHTSYHQTTTVTGRLSSSDPNLQNIPIKTEAGRAVRKAFVPRAGVRGKILSADYSQVELRILAHLSGDRNLVKAFREDRDIHRFTATLLYGVDEDGVTSDMRRVAKTINFSIIYGKTAYGLSQDLGIPVGEADGFIENYFKRYSGIRDYMEAQKKRAREDGYLTTILGRRSYFPDINSPNGMKRQFAERAAINAPIQGSAADLIKMAMLRIQPKLDSMSLGSRMIMQVHDELVFDVPEGEEESLTALVRDGMEKAYTMSVPLRVDVNLGPSWYKP